MPSTRVLASASSSRSSACARSEPYATTFASIGSYAVVTSVPVSTQPSTRTPRGNSTRVNRPALGRCSRERVLGVHPRLDGVAARRPGIAYDIGVAAGQPQHPRDEVDPVDLLGDRMLHLQPGVDLQEVRLLAGRRRRRTRPCRRSGSRRAAHKSRAAVGELLSYVRQAGPGAGASSTTFWLRRCSEQSRSPKVTTRPSPSPNTCTSTWRACSTSRSRKTPAEEKVAAATRCTRSQASREVLRRAARAHADAAAAAGRLEHHRVADGLGRGAGPRRRPRAGPVPGASGTPAASAAARAVCLAPNSSSCSGVGPTNAMPGVLGSAGRTPRPRTGSRSRGGSPRHRCPAPPRRTRSASR